MLQSTNNEFDGATLQEIPEELRQPRAVIPSAISLVLRPSGARCAFASPGRDGATRYAGQDHGRPDREKGAPPDREVRVGRRLKVVVRQPLLYARELLTQVLGVSEVHRLKLPTVQGLARA